MRHHTGRQHAFTAREVHIRLIVFDPEAVDSGLELAAAELRQRALRAPDLRTARLCVQARERILAVAEAYARFKVLSLAHQVDVVRAMPRLYEGLRACVEEAGLPALPPNRERFRAISAPVLYAAEHVVGDLVEDAVEHCVDARGCALSFAVERADVGEWVIAAGVEPERATVMSPFSRWSATLSRCVRRRRSPPPELVVNNA